MDSIENKDKINLHFLNDWLPLRVHDGSIIDCFSGCMVD